MRFRSSLARTSFLFATSIMAMAVAFAACAGDDEVQRRTRRPNTGADGKDEGRFEDPTNTEIRKLPDPLSGLPHGESQNSALCGRLGEMNDRNANFNAVTNAFCKEGVRPTSLVELQAALGLTFKRTDERGTNGSNENPGFAFLAHSSSLVARGVSAVNPRAFVFSAPAGQPTRIPGFVVTGFARGEPFVEIAAEQGKGGKVSFYFVKFDLACEPDCKPKDLFTPEIESNWKGITVYDDEDLKNTIVDCRHCHQPDGPSQKMMLRMQELEDPWTHWFRSDRPGGLTLMQDFFRAHGEEEDYGGVPAPLIPKADGRALEDLVKGQGFEDQPNAFNSKRIENEITASSPLQPQINTERGKSETWQELYDRSLAGQFIPVPYHDVKVTSPNRLQYVTDKYRAWKEDSSTDLPDLRRVFLEDEGAIQAMLFKPKAGSSGESVIIQACAQCHNGRLDQNISRAKFDATALGGMDSAAKREAIRRINLPVSDILHMPPAFMREMPDDAKAAAVQALSK